MKAIPLKRRKKPLSYVNVKLIYADTSFQLNYALMRIKRLLVTSRKAYKQTTAVNGDSPNYCKFKLDPRVNQKYLHNTQVHNEQRN